MVRSGEPIDSKPKLIQELRLSFSLASDEAHLLRGDRGQSTLFPASLDDYVTEDNPVRAVDVFVDGFCQPDRDSSVKPERGAGPNKSPALLGWSRAGQVLPWKAGRAMRQQADRSKT